LEYIFNDGGRSVAGYEGSAGDCVVRAIAIATETPYQTVYDDLFSLNKTQKGKLRGASPRNGGTKTATIRKYMKSLGWEFIPTMDFGSGCTTHLKADELPKGRIVARVSKHLVAVIDGVLNDTYDCSRGETRCVYGYYAKATPPEVA
jgi:hypothetical protein